VRDIPSAGALVERLSVEYAQARNALAASVFDPGRRPD
jgi:hypothetical protein